MASQMVGGREVQSYQKFTPQQMKLFKSLFSQVDPGSYLSKLASGDPELMAKMEKGQLRDFSSTMGNLASRFSGAGTGGRHSSGFKLAQGQEARQFQEQMQAQRQQLQQQAIKDLMGLSQGLLGQDPYEQFLVEPQGKQEWWQQAIGGGAPLAGAAIGGYAGGLPGAKLGGSLGSAFGSAFGGR